MSMSPSLIERIEDLLRRLEPLLPPPAPVDWRALAFQWRRRNYLGATVGQLLAVRNVAAILPEDLKHVDGQKQAILRNTEQFVRSGTDFLKRYATPNDIVAKVSGVEGVEGAFIMISLPCGSRVQCACRHERR